MNGPISRRAPGLAWSSQDALRCGLCTLPAALVIVVGNPSKGLAWAVGVLPAAIIGLAPERRQRVRIAAVGVLFALSVLLGSLLAQTDLTAVVGIFVVAFAAAVLASHRPVGLVAMTLCAPVTAIGLSYADVTTALWLGLIMFGGSVFTWLVFLAWPDAPVAARAAPQLLPKTKARQYGLSSGLAAAVATAVGIAINTDHIGWAPAAALLVMRPADDMFRLRMVGRLVSVLLGALAAMAFLRVSPSDAAVAVVAIAALAGAGGTHASRWYVTSLFTTFLVLTMLLWSDATVANEQWRFAERVGETCLGVGLAYVFGLVLPRALRQFDARQTSRDRTVA
jgi:hypothetical protein